MTTKEEDEKAGTISPTSEPWEPQAVAGAILDPRVQKVIDVMKESLNRRNRLSDLAEMVNLSRFRLSHLFKSETGFSLGEYLRRLRMEKARQLLENTRLSIKEIMFATGYNGRGEFIRHFKRSFALTPTQYRKSVLALTLKRHENRLNDSGASPDHGPMRGSALTGKSKNKKCDAPSRSQVSATKIVFLL